MPARRSRRRDRSDRARSPIAALLLGLAPRPPQRVRRCAATLAGAHHRHRHHGLAPHGIAHGDEIDSAAELPRQLEPSGVRRPRPIVIAEDDGNILVARRQRKRPQRARVEPDRIVEPQTLISHHGSIIPRIMMRCTAANDRAGAGMGRRQAPAPQGTRLRLPASTVVTLHRSSSTATGTCTTESSTGPARLAHNVPPARHARRRAPAYGRYSRCQAVEQHQQRCSKLANDGSWLTVRWSSWRLGRAGRTA